jgi:hypothetical protein
VNGAPRIAGRAALLCAALGIAGCAALAPAQGPAAAPAAAPAGPGASTTAGSGAPPGAGIDTLPSPDAQRVLASIPEPVAPADSQPAAPAARAVADSVHGDSLNSAPPVPAPTTPLGEQPGSRDSLLSPVAAVGAGSSGAAAGAAGAASPSTAGAAAPSERPAGPSGAAAGTAAGAAAVPGAPSGPASSRSSPCYRLQIAATSDAHRAEGLRKAGESQLELRFVTRKSGGLYKAVSRDCLSREAADHLKARAGAAGFHGVFVVADGKQ